VRAVAAWCYDRRRLVLLAWVVAFLGLTALGSSVSTAYKDTFKLSGTDSAEGYNLLAAVAPAAAGDVEQIVIVVDSGNVRDAAVRSQVASMLAKVAGLPHVASVASPYGPGGGSQISPNGRIAYATVHYDVTAISITQATAKAFVSTAQKADHAGLHVYAGGQVAELANRTSLSGTGIGIAAAALVLLLVFGSLLAAVVPLITALISLGTGIALVGLLSHLLAVASFSSQLSTLVGLGVGVDYALFIVTRYRQGLMRGLPARDAAVSAMDTSGRAVLFAGITVCIALLGLFTLGVSFLYGVALAAAVTVALTVAAALTLLPALLGFFGSRLLSRKNRRAVADGALTADDESPRWGSWARLVQGRPASSAAIAAVVLLLLAVPLTSLRLGSSDQGNDPSGSTTRQAYDALAKGFGPGFNGPLQLIAPIRTSADRATLTTALAAVGRTSGVVATTPPVFLPARGGHPGVGLASVFPSGSPQDESTSQLISRLRHTALPRALASTGTVIHVGGQTAMIGDFSRVLTAKLPLFIGIVVLLSFLLLVAVFRSLVIPATAAVMNLLSAGAAFGAVVWVFQWGHQAHLIGVGKGGPIEAFVPVMMFAILFGLSMDYQVFLVSRIYEEWHKRGDNSEAVTHGLAVTGRTITAAASIMILVFGAFLLGDNRVIKLFGFGLAAAVLLDALIVRTLLVPALMHLFGRANWALPSALDRVIPRLNVEGRRIPEDLPAPTAHEVALAPGN
jgi:RND superfamily putative drug exporter